MPAGSRPAAGARGTRQHLREASPPVYPGSPSRACSQWEQEPREKARRSRGRAWPPDASATPAAAVWHEECGSGGGGGLLIAYLGIHDGRRPASILRVRREETVAPGGCLANHSSESGAPAGCTAGGRSAALVSGALAGRARPKNVRMCAEVDVLLLFDVSFLLSLSFGLTIVYSYIESPYPPTCAPLGVPQSLTSKSTSRALLSRLGSGRRAKGVRHATPARERPPGTRRNRLGGHGYSALVWRPPLLSHGPLLRPLNAPSLICNPTDWALHPAGLGLVVRAATSSRRRAHRADQRQNEARHARVMD